MVGWQGGLQATGQAGTVWPELAFDREREEDMIPEPSGGRMRRLDSFNHFVGERKEGSWEGSQYRALVTDEDIALGYGAHSKPSGSTRPLSLRSEPILEFSEERPSESALLLSNGENNAHFFSFIKEAFLSL